MQSLKDENPEVYQKFVSGYHVVRRSERLWAGLSTDLVIEQVLMRNLKTTGGLTRGSGMTERQRLTWLLSMPVCAETNSAMQELTGVKYDSSEQNKDMTNSRQKRDMNDAIVILKTLVDGKNPFAPDPVLKNIMSGVNAEESVDVDEARAKGEKILSSMAGQSVVTYSFKQNKQSVTLATRSSVRIDGDRVHVDPQLLFQRLVFACNNTDDLEEVFRYELCSYPAALFDTPVTLRQPQKATLADALWAKLSSDAKSSPSGNVQYVLDGGALLHRVPWPRQVTYQEVCHIYCQYVLQKYGNQTVVVFDGYDKPSTKSMTHQRRSAGKGSATVTFSDGMKITMKKDAFLSNAENKKRFITILRRFLQEVDCHTIQAEGDADVLIVKTAVDSAAERPTVLVGDDTDLIVLLCYLTQPDGYDLYFRPEPKANSRQSKVWNMKQVKAELGHAICHSMLFLHAVLGCDTTSRPYGIGKAASLKKYSDSVYFQEQARVFDTASTPDDVATAGENALVALYGGKQGESLDSLRYRRYYEKVATRGRQVQPQNLPPTSSAARYHSFRVFLQVKQWEGRDESMSLEDWGWKLSSGQVLPVTTDLPAAPESLLKMIRCNCATDCSTARCTCRKHDLDCSPACDQCRGTGCTNNTILDDNDEDDD